MRPAQFVGDAQAAAFLAGRFGGDASGLTPLDAGDWSRAFAFRQADRDCIIRFSAFDQDFRKDQWASANTSPALPIPRLLEIGRAFAGFYAISERASGAYLDILGHERMQALLPSLFAALDALRCVDLSATSGYGLWDVDGTALHPSWHAALLDAVNDRPESRTYGWREQLAASPTGSGPFDEAYRRLEALVEFCPEERHLVHSDLLNRNVLVCGAQISAVLDWGSSIYGDFLYDIAWFAFWSPWFPAWRGIDFPQEAARHYATIGLDVPNFTERLRCCQIHIGLDGQAYNAFRRRWPSLAAIARRTLAVAGRG